MIRKLRVTVEGILNISVPVAKTDMVSVPGIDDSGYNLESPNQRSAPLWRSIVIAPSKVLTML